MPRLSPGQRAGSFPSNEMAVFAAMWSLGPVLGLRLLECSEAVLVIPNRSAHAIFGSPDDLKLRSCATLFAGVTSAGSVFEQLLDKHYQGERDEQTLRWLGSASV